MFYYLNLFLISSCFGYLLETCLKTFIFHSMNNGILFGPWIPVYGFGVVIISLVGHFIFQDKKISSWKKITFVFLICFFLLTFLEWLGGILIEKLFHKIFWDYSKLKFNIGHYIALEMSLLWSVFSIVFLFLIKPVEDLIIKKIPRWLTSFVFFLFLLDFFMTILKEF